MKERIEELEVLDKEFAKKDSISETLWDARNYWIERCARGLKTRNSKIKELSQTKIATLVGMDKGQFSRQVAKAQKYSYISQYSPLMGRRPRVSKKRLADESLRIQQEHRERGLKDDRINEARLQDLVKEEAEEMGRMPPPALSKRSVRRSVGAFFFFFFFFRDCPSAYALP